MEFLKQGKKQARTYYNFTHAKNVKKVLDKTNLKNR